MAALREAGQSIIPEDQEPISDPKAEAQAAEAKEATGNDSGSESNPTITPGISPNQEIET